MGQVIDLASRRDRQVHRKVLAPQDELALVLARLLAAGATDFTRVALDAWGNHELEPEELMELCATYAAVAGFENV